MNSKTKPITDAIIREKQVLSNLLYKIERSEDDKMRSNLKIDIRIVIEKLKNLYSRLPKV